MFINAQESAQKNQSQRSTIPYWHKSTLILDEMGNKFYHLDSTGKELCKITTLEMPYDVAYSKADDCYYMGLIRKRAIYKVSKTGATSNEIPVGGYPCGFHLLANGNVLVAGWDDNVPGFVKEFDPKGTCVWKVEKLKWPWKAERLANGNTLIAEAGQNKVFEVDKSGKEVWSVPNLGPSNPSTFDNLGVVFCQRLSNGNTLVSVRGLHKVLELDPAGKTVWEVGSSMIKYPYSAVRIWNGNTLIVDQGNKRVIEVDSSKKIVWEKKDSYTYVAKAYRLYYDATALSVQPKLDANALVLNGGSQFVAFPIPASEKITFSITTPAFTPSYATLTIFDALGEQVFQMNSPVRSHGSYLSMEWNCKNSQGTRMNHGSYKAYLKVKNRQGEIKTYSTLVAIQQ